MISTVHWFVDCPLCTADVILQLHTALGVNGVLTLLAAQMMQVYETYNYDASTLEQPLCHVTERQRAAERVRDQLLPWASIVYAQTNAVGMCVSKTSSARTRVIIGFCRRVDSLANVMNSRLYAMRDDVLASAPTTGAHLCHLMGALESARSNTAADSCLRTALIHMRVVSECVFIIGHAHPACVHNALRAFRDYCVCFGAS
jgi:hypothetical protein